MQVHQKDDTDKGGSREKAQHGGERILVYKEAIQLF